MKKITFQLLICFFIAISFSGNAQFKINIEAGSNYSNLQLYSDNKLPDAAPAYGYFFALSPSYDLNSFLSAKLDIQTSSEPTLYNSFFVRKNTFHYMRLVPNIEIWPLDFISIYGGYSIGYKISENEIRNEVPFPSPTSDFVKPDYNHGLSVGFNVYFRAFYFTGKYYHGSGYQDAVFITDSTGTLFVGERVKNRRFQFGLGYKFSFDKFLN